MRDAITRAAAARGQYVPAKTYEITGLVSQSPDRTTATDWPTCRARNVGKVAVCCGGYAEVRICDNPSCFRFGAEVTPVICGGCVDRLP